MKAVVFHDIGDIRLDDVPAPKIKEPTDAIVRITASAICGTDLHMVRGTMTGMKSGTILGHEGVGIVEELGKGVRNLKEGDRVVIPSTIACGYCAYCREGLFSQCDNSNPHGKSAGTAFFGGPASTGPFDGLQAERARIPYANVGLVKLPDSVTDDQAILLSDIFPTGYFGADLAHVRDGETVAVFGCGPVGIFSILSANLMNAGRIIAVDRVASRLNMAREFGAEIINFDKEDPVEIIKEMTGGIGVDCCIDAVGVDAEAPSSGPAESKSKKMKKEHEREVKEVAPKTKPEGELWKPGDAPSQALQWAVESVAKVGTLAIIGVYPETVRFFPTGMAMMKNLTVRLGNCNHRRYIPRLIEMIQGGALEIDRIISNSEPFSNAIEAYRTFDKREPGWIKVELMPQPALAETI